MVKEDFLEEVSRNCRRGTWIPRTVVVGRKEMAWFGKRECRYQRLQVVRRGVPVSTFQPYLVSLGLQGSC